jgi:dephospho-CoA kinase
MLHPRVREETVRRAAESGADVFVAEIPLLFEGERGDSSTIPSRSRRQTGGVGRGPRSGVWERISAAPIEDRQLSGEEKARLADVVVENDGDLDKLREQAKALVDRALGRRGSVGESGAEEE